MKQLSRRDFLAVAGAASLAAYARSSFAAGDPIILGSGSQRYAWVPDWLVPSPDIVYGDTHGIAQDSHGRIYLSHTVHPTSVSDHAICVFDRHGKFLTSWGGRFKGGGHGLDIRKEGHHEYIYHCDIAHRLVVKTELDGKVVWERGIPVEAGVYNDKTPYVPTNVAFAPNGDLYVGDGYGSSFIHQYTKDGEWIRTWGGRGVEPGKMDCPHGLWVDPRGHEPLLAVADRSNHRIQYFSLDGKHVRFDTAGMRQPCHFRTLGDLMLVPDLNSVVTLLDGANQPVVQLGDGDPSDLRGHPRSDFIPGKFIHPHGACWVNGEDICVVEWVPIGRVTLLKKLA